jgi:hypothetical protein
MTSHIYVKVYENDKKFNWYNCWEISFESYSIDESDFRNKTATFKSDMNLFVEGYSYAVKITSPTHETFSGIILKRNKKPDNLNEYSCQDWNRLYMSKPQLTMKAKVHNIIKKCLTYCINKSWVDNGLLAIKRYGDRRLGGATNTNGMKNIKNVKLKDKTCKEIIQDLVYGEKMRVDLHYNNTGIMKFTPRTDTQFMKSVADFDKTELVDYDYSFNTTDIITAVKLKNKTYTFGALFNNKKNPLYDFVNQKVEIESSIPTSTGNTATTNRNTSNNSNKTSNRNDKQTNPYGTKNKEVWVTMDNCWGHNTDNKFMNNLIKELKKLGWKTHRYNVGPGGIIPRHLPDKAKNGIWMVVVNGQDCEVFRHLGHDDFFKGMLLKRHMRPVLAFINIRESQRITKGGEYYKHLGMAWDGTGKGHPGLRYPAGYLAECGVPFFFTDKGNHPKQCAKLFDKGGDSEKALNANYKKIVKGYYSNWNWSKKY